MKIVKGSLAFAVVALVAGAAQAATVTYTLYQDRNTPNGPAVPGSFCVTAKVGGGDSAGLSGFGMDLLGVIATLDHRSPRDPSATTATQEGPTGFTFARSGDNLPFIAGFQDTSNPDAIAVYGFGQEASSFEAKGITVGGTTLEGNPWTAELILAVGTYTGAKPVFNPVSPNATANVFINNQGTAVRAPELIVNEVIPIPEPATIGMLAMVGAVAALRRRLVA